MTPPGYHDPGHTVLAVPVPELDEFVRARTAHYDRAYLSDDPRFGHAHITVLAPWIRQPRPADLAAVIQLAEQVAPFDYRLAELDTFPDGIIHLLPEPAAEFNTLTTALVELFPEYPPYAGQFPRVTPHLTLDAVGGNITQAEVQRMLGDLVPLTGHATVLQVQWWQAGHCHVQHEWQLGAGTQEGAR